MGNNEFVLKAKTRDLLGKQVKTLRQSGNIPAVLYGKGLESKHLVVDEIEFSKLYSTVGSSTLIDLDLEGEKVKSIVKTVSIHPITQKVEHIEFYQIDMKSEITASIPIVLSGESSAVKNNLGLLFTPTEEIEVRCLPSKLPKEIVVPIDKLDNVGDSVLVKDIVLPEGVEIDSGFDVNQAVAVIEEPQMAEETEEIQITSVDDVEVTTEKEETEEGTEEASVKE